jgi:hypothetical protein
LINYNTPDARDTQAPNLLRRAYRVCSRLSDLLLIAAPPLAVAVAILVAGATLAASVVPPLAHMVGALAVIPRPWGCSGAMPC